MCQFPLFETLSIIDGKVQNLDYHQKRFEQAVQKYFDCEPTFTLAQILVVPEAYQQGKIRCRIDYNASEFEIKFLHTRQNKSNVFVVWRWKIGIIT